MPKYLYLTDYQQKIVKAEAPYTVVGHSAGSGTTFALIHAASNWCNDNPNKNVTFFTPQKSVQASGGVVSLAKDILLEDCNWKFSERSNIFTLNNGARVKFVSAAQDIEATFALDRDFIIFDANCPDEVVVFHLKRGRKAVVADYLLDILQPSSWAMQYGLLKEDVSGFLPIITYVPATGAESNPFMVENNPTYIKLISQLPMADKERLTRVAF